MGAERRIWAGFVVLGLALCAVPARAAPADERTSAPATPSSLEGTSRALITLAALPAHADELTVLIQELLAAEGVSVEFANVARSEPAELLAARAADSRVHVLIRVDAQALLRLYFRGPGGERFLLRKLALANGLDAVERELVAQVVAASVVALLHSPVGLSRAQASAELARETLSPPTGAVDQAAPSAEPVVRSAKGASAPSKPPARPLAPPKTALLLSVAAGYALELAQPDFGLSHGPDLEVRLASRSKRLLGARIVAERFFATRVVSSDVTATLQTSVLRGSFDIGLPLGREGFAVLAIGAGLDWTRIAPGAPHAIDVTPLAPRTDLVPMLRPEFRYEMLGGPMVFAVSVFADIALLATHYDLVEAGNSRRLAAPWLVRPGIVVSIGFHIL